jgi:hypothetical protein
MNIRFVSSLTTEDEVRLAEGLLIALAAMLDQFAIAYTLKIEAGDSYVGQHDHAPGQPSMMAHEPTPDAESV